MDFDGLEAAGSFAEIYDIPDGSNTVRSSGSWSGRVTSMA